MRNLVRHLDNTMLSGLHCVWESAREGEQTRLVARWINSDAEEVGSHGNGDAIDCDEAGEPWLGMSLQFV